MRECRTVGTVHHAERNANRSSKTQCQMNAKVDKHEKSQAQLSCFSDG